MLASFWLSQKRDNYVEQKKEENLKRTLTHGCVVELGRIACVLRVNARIERSHERRRVAQHRDERFVVQDVAFCRRHRNEELVAMLLQLLFLVALDMGIVALVVRRRRFFFPFLFWLLLLRGVMAQHI